MDEEINLLDYIRIIREKWRIWFFTFLITEIVVLIITLITPKTYEAIATLLPPELTGGEGSSLSANLPSILREQIPGLESPPALSEVIVAIFESRRMRYKIAQEFNLGEDVVMEITSISRSKNGLINIKITTSNPQLAADVANAYISNLELMNEELKVTANKPVVTVLDPAIPSECPAGPKLILNLIISGVLALFVSIVLSFFVNYFQNIKKPITAN